MKEIHYNNFTLFVPARYCTDNFLGRFTREVYEKSEVEDLSTFYNENDFVLEIGSCIGYTACLLSKCVKQVISIEANPELKECLNKCKSVNNLDNVTFLNTIVSNKNTLKFQTYDLMVAGSAFRTDNGQNWSNTRKDYTINATRLEAIPEIDNVNALFLDMEGGELTFLKENMQFIKNKINKISVELHGFIVTPHAEDIYNQEVLDLMSDQNFDLIKRNGRTYLFRNKS